MEEDIFDYLHELRESGVTNILLAPSFLEREFGLTKKEATDYFWKWTETFND